MIRAILRAGTIEPLDELPGNWSDGQELVIEACAPSDEPAEIEDWYKKLRELSAGLSIQDRDCLEAALAEQDRVAKDLMRKELGLN
jgi:hypothetical protein